MVTNVTGAASGAFAAPAAPALTARQEQFCGFIAATGNASEAYRRSFDCAHMQPGSIGTEAKRLKRIPKIAARIVALRAALPEHERAEFDMDNDTEAAARPPGTVAETLGLVARLKAEPDLLQWDDKRAKRLTLNAHLGHLARIRELALARGHHRVALAAECERASYGNLRDELEGAVKSWLELRAQNNVATPWGPEPGDADFPPASP